MIAKKVTGRVDRREEQGYNWSCPLREAPFRPAGCEGEFPQRTVDKSIEEKEEACDASLSEPGFRVRGRSADCRDAEGGRHKL
jgi:hypothetical protein